MTRWRVMACLLAMTLATTCAPDGESAPAILLEGRPSGEVTENGPSDQGATSDGEPSGIPAEQGSPSAAPDPSTSRVEGQALDTEEVVQAVGGLCLARVQASSDPRAARATFTRSRAGIETTARALQPSYSPASASVTEMSALVEADLAADPPRPTLDLHLGMLTERMREGLARLGIRSSPCKK